jgi:DNA polymerase
MNGFAERDAIFLAEMGITPLWALRDAPALLATEAAAVAVAAAAVAADAAELADDVAGVAALAVAVAEATPAAGQDVSADAFGETAPAVTAVPPAQPAAPAAPAPAAPAPREPARGPRPLQPVAQSVSALAPVPVEDLAWDDAALPADATPEEIAQMDWDQLGLAIAACRRCSACRDGRAPVPGTGSKTARWLVAAGASTAADEKARIPLAGEPGKLLDNMLAAVELSRERDVYITNLIKCRPTTPGGGERAPTAEEAAACRPYLERELVLTGAGTVLTLGQIAANTLLGRPMAEALAGVRGKAYPLQSAQATLVATLHPGELLRRGGDKALAWADLCRARAAAGTAAGTAVGTPGAGRG